MSDRVQDLVATNDDVALAEMLVAAWAEVEQLRKAAEEVIAQDLSGETVSISYAAYKKLDAALFGETEAE